MSVSGARWHRVVLSLVQTVSRRTGWVLVMPSRREGGVWPALQRFYVSLREPVHAVVRRRDAYRITGCIARQRLHWRRAACDRIASARWPLVVMMRRAAMVFGAFPIRSRNGSVGGLAVRLLGTLAFFGWQVVPKTCDGCA